MPAKTSRGQKYAATVRDLYDLNPSDEIVVDEIAAVLDVLASPDLTVQETRQQRLLLSRLLLQLGLPVPGAQPVDRSTMASQKGRRASRARWGDG